MMKKSKKELKILSKKLGYGVETKICGVCRGNKELNQIVCSDCHKKKEPA